MSPWWYLITGHWPVVKLCDLAQPSPMRPLYEAGNYAEAADRGCELLRDDPPYSELYYNVACCERLAGQKD